MNNSDLYRFTHKGAESVSDIVKKSIKASGVELINETSNANATDSSAPYKYDYSLLSIDMPNATKIGNSYFEVCASLTTCNFPKVWSIGQYAFRDCVSLEYIYIPEVTTIYPFAFAGCISLKTINIDSAVSIASDAFSGCCSITNVHCPNAIYISSYAFYRCVSMRSFIGLKVTEIGKMAFAYCASLMCVRLDNSDVVTLSDVSAFNGTPIKNGNGYVYVKDELVDSYKSATNWTAYADKIKPISELSE